MQPEAIELVALLAAALAFAFAFGWQRRPRRALLARGTAGLAGAAAIALVPSIDLVLLVLLSLGAIQSSFDGRRVAVRFRAVGVAVALLGLGLAFARVEGPLVLERFAAVGVVAGLALAVGVLPFVHAADSDQDISSSPIVWMAFVGPVLATVVAFRAEQVLSPDAGDAFGAMLIGLGLINLVWGNLGAWLTASRTTAWRYSFMADWGLVLCGLGLLVRDAAGAALLVLFSVILGRLPIYLVSRDAPTDANAPQRPINLVVAALLAGSAPFAGFAARVLLLRGATDLYWPLALALGLGMLLWLPGSLRLGQTIAVPRGRRALGIALVIAINIVVGLYPLPLLSAAGL